MMRTKLALAIFSAVVLASPAWPQAQEARIDSIQGPVLFQAYCAVCHGKDAKGNGPMTKNLRVSPPDLTRYAARRGGEIFRAQMRRIILGDFEDDTLHGTREMPIWGPVFSEIGPDDRNMGLVRVDNLIRYIESLQVP